MSLKEYLLFFALFALALGLVLYFRMREQRYLKKKVKDALSHRLKKEIENEQEANKRKKEKFESELKRMGG